MKKILLLIFSLFILLNKVNADARFHVGEKVEPNFYVERVNNERRHNGLLFKLYREDGEFVYCIDPFETRVSNALYKEYNYNNSIFNISNDNLDMINKIAYFGYGYNNHTDIKWYGITQFLIWQKLNLVDVFLTDYQYGNKVEPYNSEINEIYKLINEYNELPSFANKTIIYNSNSRYELEDTKKVFSSYDIVSTDLQVEKKNNTLVINTRKDGIYTIKFKKSSPITREFKMYYASDTQSFIYPGKFNDITFELKIEVISGSVNLTKIGNSESTDSTLEGAIYGIYQNGIQVKSITTDNKGVGYIDNLPVGKYTLKEITPPKGYLLDNNSYDFEITKQNRNIYIESHEDLIYGDLVINKYFGDVDNYKKEDGAIFEVYDSKYNLYGVYETVDGVINIKLPYGRYNIVQKTTKEGYKKTDNFSITIDGNTKNEYNLYDELIKGELLLNKFNMDNESCNKEEGAVFEVYKDDVLYGTYETTDGIIDIKLPYGKYKIKQIKGIEGYKFADDLDIFIDSENKFSFDLYDELIYGNLVINKYYGEIDNYKKEDGAIFEVYRDDILYDTYKTVDGIISINIPYGKYKIKQIKGIDGYKFAEDLEVFINKEDRFEFNLYDELIYGNLLISKYYGDSDNYKEEDGAIFKVSNDIDNYEGVTTKGKLSMKLPYGDYKVEQVKGIIGYDYVDDFTVSINNDEDYDYDLYDEIIVNVPNTGVKNNVNYIFIVYIIIGLFLIIFSIKKTTHE